MVGVQVGDFSEFQADFPWMQMTGCEFEPRLLSIEILMEYVGKVTITAIEWSPGVWD